MGFVRGDTFRVSMGNPRVHTYLGEHVLADLGPVMHGKHRTVAGSRLPYLYR